MPYQKRNTYPRNEQHDFIRYTNIKACITNGGSYEIDQAMRGIQECLLALKQMPLAIHIESFTTEMFHLVSEDFARVHGYTVEELDCVLLSDLCVPERQATLEHYHNLAMQAGEAAFDTEHERKDGSHFPVHIEMRLLQQEQENIALLSTLSYDQEAKSATSEFEAERQRYARAFDKLLEERNEARMQMLDSLHLAYEHNNATRGLMELLLHEDMSMKEVREFEDYFRTYRKQLGHVYALLIEAQQRDDFSLTVPLRPLLMRLVDAWRIDYPFRPFVIEIDDIPIYVRQFFTLSGALEEIVKNALQHGAGCVSLWVRADNGQMTVTVRDQGPGFPPDFQPRTGSGSVGSENTMGLGVVSRTQWGLSPIQGEVRYENAPEGGAQVVLTFAFR